jgi:hypothetical protein
MAPQSSSARKAIRPPFIGEAAYFLIAVVVLFLGFDRNTWHIAEQAFFDNHQISMESFIVGRIVKTSGDGLLSAGGLPGLVGPDAAAPDIENANYKFQYQAFRQSLPFQSFAPYKSQNGGQGMLFGALAGLIPLPNPAKLDLFHGLTALLSAVSLALILVWCFREFGFGAGGMALIAAVFSQWLVVFGKNLWWSIWAFYLPMVIVLYTLAHAGGIRKVRPIRFGLVVFLAVLVKCFFNGYEYITTTLLMMVVPYVYFSVRDRVGWKILLTGLLTAVAASALAILVSMTVLCFQIAAIDGSVAKGIEHIVSSLLRRTYADAQLFPADYTASLDASPVDVVITYLKATYFDVNNFLSAPSAWIAKYIFNIRYGYLIALFAAASATLLFTARSKPNTGLHPAAGALVAALWFSLLAPLSWLIIFKAHSYVHTFMNNLVWQMPFTLLGFAACGLAISAAVRALHPPSA